MQDEMPCEQLCRSQTRGHLHLERTASAVERLDTEPLSSETLEFYYFSVS